MIRARKEDGCSSTVLRHDGDQQQLRRPLNISSINPLCPASNTVSATAAASCASISPNKRGAASSSSVSSSFVALSAGSMQLYSHFTQQGEQQRPTAKRKRSSSSAGSFWGGGGGGSSKKNGGIWTVQVPKRMLLSTLGVFLILPLVIFFWKETHPADPKDQLRGSATTVELKKKNRFVTWMEDNVPEDVYNETEGGGDVGGAIFLPEPISVRPRGSNNNNKGSSVVVVEGSVPQNNRTESDADQDAAAEQAAEPKSRLKKTDRENASAGKTARKDDSTEVHLPETDGQEDDLEKNFELAAIASTGDGTTRKMSAAGATRAAPKKLVDDATTGKKATVLERLKQAEAGLESTKQDSKESEGLASELERDTKEERADDDAGEDGGVVGSQER